MQSASNKGVLELIQCNRHLTSCFVTSRPPRFCLTPPQGLCLPVTDGLSTDELFTLALPEPDDGSLHAPETAIRAIVAPRYPGLGRESFGGDVCRGIIPRYFIAKLVVLIFSGNIIERSALHDEELYQGF